MLRLLLLDETMIETDRLVIGLHTVGHSDRTDTATVRARHPPRQTAKQPGANSQTEHDIYKETQLNSLPHQQTNKTQHPSRRPDKQPATTNSQTEQHVYQDPLTYIQPRQQSNRTQHQSRQTVRQTQQTPRGWSTGLFSSRSSCWRPPQLRTSARASGSWQSCTSTQAELHSSRRWRPCSRPSSTGRPSRSRTCCRTPGTW